MANELASLEIRAEAEEYFRRLSDSGLPHDYRNGIRAVEHVAPEAAEALMLCEGLGTLIKGLYLWGGVGTYKTSVAAAWLTKVIAGGGRGRYVFLPDLMSRLHAIYSSKDGDSRDAIVSRYVDTPRLVLDDLGAEKPSQHAAEVLGQIMDGRYRIQGGRRWMIVTSNFPLTEITARFTDSAGEEAAARIERRMAELTVSVPMGQ